MQSYAVGLLLLTIDFETYKRISHTIGALS